MGTIFSANERKGQNLAQNPEKRGSRQWGHEKGSGGDRTKVGGAIRQTEIQTLGRVPSLVFFPCLLFARRAVTSFSRVFLPAVCRLPLSQPTLFIHLPAHMLSFHL